MLKTLHWKFHIKRREFLKTTALAGMTIALPGITVLTQDAEPASSDARCMQLQQKMKSQW